jgi:hypothetical protein
MKKISKLETSASSQPALSQLSASSQPALSQLSASNFFSSLFLLTNYFQLFIFFKHLFF